MRIAACIVADADVITALIFLRIVEPEKSSSVGSGISNGSQEAPTAAAASVAAKVFKPQDTAALRTVAVEVGGRTRVRHVLVSIRKCLSSIRSVAARRVIKGRD